MNISKNLDCLYYLMNENEITSHFESRVACLTTLRKGRNTPVCLPFHTLSDRRPDSQKLRNLFNSHSLGYCSARAFFQIRIHPKSCKRHLAGYAKQRMQLLGSYHLSQYKGQYPSVFNIFNFYISI